MTRDLKIKNIWGEADKLWNQWLASEDFDKQKEGRLEVDNYNLREMQMDQNQWMANVQMIGSDGRPVQEYRGAFEIVPFMHWPKIEGPVALDDPSAPATLEHDTFYPHLSLCFIGANGRWKYLNWEGNHDPYA